MENLAGENTMVPKARGSTKLKRLQWDFKLYYRLFSRTQSPVHSHGFLDFCLQIYLGS